MIRLVELDFTRFSGGVPIDNVSDTTLSGVTSGSPNLARVMPSFTFRPGAYFTVDNVVDSYTFSVSTVGGESLKMSSTYSPTSKRSFVLWYYCYSTSHDTGAINYIWGGDANGFALTSVTGLQYIRDDAQVYATSSGTSVGWHNAVITIDRLNNEYRCYYNGDPVYNDTSIPSTTYNYLDATIGQLSTGAEADFGLGYIATYDSILSPVEISILYNNFLLDAKNPYPFTKMVGVVRDVDGATISGANVLLYDHVSHQTVDEAVSDSTGVYTVRFPSPGEYSIYSSKSGTAGGRAASLTVTSGEQIIVYDEE